MEKVYVGIDVNLTGFGLAILKSNKITLKFVPFHKQGLSINFMMKEWVRGTADLMTEILKAAPRYKENPNDTSIILAVEEPAGMGAGAEQAAAILNKLIGIIAAFARVANYSTMHPSSMMWKKSIVGKGNATKDEVATVVSKKILGHEDRDYFGGNHHISDAVGLALYAKEVDNNARPRDNSISPNCKDKEESEEG